jgi:hypothetical protein
VAALAACLLAFAPAAQSRSAQSLSLNVEFSYTGQISVTLPNGTPVGTTSGSPTVIPAGYYSVILSGPGGCTLTPYFMLRGPGVAITDNMAQGEDFFTEIVTNLLPNSTYTWRNSDNPSVVYTFTTSGDIVGTQPPPAVWNGPTSGKKSQNSDIVGSNLSPFRGALAGTVGTGGQLTLTYKGKRVVTLKAGRYTFAVTDRSTTNGLQMVSGKRKAVRVSAADFVGRLTASVTLSAGKWVFSTVPAKQAQTVVVS